MSYTLRWSWYGDIVEDVRIRAIWNMRLRAWLRSLAWSGGSDFSREVLIPPVGWVAAIAKDASCAGRN